MYANVTAYPLLRESLAVEYVELSDEQLDFIVGEIYGEGVTAEDVESFWNDVGKGFQTVGKGVGRFAKQAAPVLGRALPSIAQGALTGASVGGPFGAIAGAAIGGAGGVLSQSKNRTLRSIGGGIGAVGNIAGSFTGGGAMGNLAKIGLGALGRGGARGLAQTALGAIGQRGGALGAIGQVAGSVAPQVARALGSGAGGSANALLGLLSRPETLRALSSAAMGQYGRQNVMVGQQAVPVQSILSALGGLAGRAAGEAEFAGEQMPGYFFGADGELAIDPADSDERVDALLELFSVTPVNGQRYALVREPDEYDEAEYTDEDAYYDELLLISESESDEYMEEESDA